MSKKILFGSLDTIALLLSLSSEKFISSGIIHNKFHTVDSGTIYQKLKKLIEQGFIEEKTKKMARAGDDQMEYRLTDEGLKFRNMPVNRGLVVLNNAINTIVKQKTNIIEKTLVEDKEEKVKDFLMEFSEDCAEMVNRETLIEQQKILEKLLRKFL